MSTHVLEENLALNHLESVEQMPPPRIDVDMMSVLPSVSSSEYKESPPPLEARVLPGTPASLVESTAPITSLAPEEQQSPTAQGSSAPELNLPAIPILEQESVSTPPSAPLPVVDGE